MVMLRVRRRAASVPVGEVDAPPVETNLATQNSLLFSKAAIDNTDALSSASKRNDQQFLRDISARIGSAPFTQPSAVRTVKKIRTYDAGFPLSTRRRSIAVSSVLRPPPPVINDTTDEDVDYEVKLIAPLTNRISRYGRATSVPPLTGGVLYPIHPIIGNNTGLDYNRPVITGDDAEFYHTPTIYEFETHQKQPSVTSGYAQKLNPVAELAVRQAHRNLDRIERELKNSVEETSVIGLPSPRTSIYTSYRDGLGPWRRSASYHGPRTSTVRTRSPSPVGRVAATPVRRYVRSTYTKSGGVPLLNDEELPLAKLDRDLKTELLLASNGPVFYPLPSSVYRSKTDLPLSSSTVLSLTRPLEWSPGPDDIFLHHRVLPPVKTTTSLSKVSIEPPYVPYLNTLPTSLTTTTFTTHAPMKPSLVPPPASNAQPIPTGLPPVIRPKVSQTRRKVRDVLCKVKGDPHYFDY